MTYTKINWENAPSTSTPINKDNLNHMEEGIAQAHEELITKMDKENPTGTGSFSMGRKANTDVGEYSHAEGYEVEASGLASHAEGTLNIATGENAHAEGYNTIASGYCSHSEGYRNTGIGGVAEIGSSGFASHAEGVNTDSSGYASHAESGETIATGEYSHAEGHLTVANGKGSHTEGGWTTTNGEYSHAEGYNTIASGNAQHVQGRYNKEDKEGVYAYIVGGGASDNERKNIHTLDWQGNAVFVGDVTNGKGVSMDGLKELIESELVKDTLTIAGINMKDNITVEELTAALDLDSKADKESPEFTGTATFKNIRVEKMLMSDSNKIGISYETKEGSVVNGTATETVVADLVLGNLDYGESNQWLPTLKFNGDVEIRGNMTAENFSGIAKNFTTEDWNQVASAPLVKQLYEENQNLKQQLNNKKFAYEKESYVSANSTLQLELSKGMYIITFGQGGAWDITGMAFAVMTDMQQSSVCYKVCGSAMFLEKMDIVLNASGKTINITNGNGANVTLRIYSI